MNMVSLLSKICSFLKTLLALGFWADLCFLTVKVEQKAWPNSHCKSCAALQDQICKYKLLVREDKENKEIYGVLEL